MVHKNVRTAQQYCAIFHVRNIWHYAQLPDSHRTKTIPAQVHTADIYCQRDSINLTSLQRCSKQQNIATRERAARGGIFRIGLHKLSIMTVYNSKAPLITNLFVSIIKYMAAKIYWCIEMPSSMLHFAHYDALKGGEKVARVVLPVD